MAESARQLRRAITRLIIRNTIAATGFLPMRATRSVVRAVIAQGAVIPALRRRVRRHMQLALGDTIPAGAERRYFEHIAWSLSNALATYHNGIAATPVLDEVKFDETIDVVDQAAAAGRGIVMISPHWCGHELVGGVISRRHPMAMLARQATSAEAGARKAKWYAALGVDVLLRPAQAWTMRDAVRSLKVFKSGKILGITPDLLADPGQGVEVTIFGRHARLNGGAFALAIAARVPMIRLYFVWQSGHSVIARFERAPEPAANDDDRDAAIRASAQDWCCWFEQKLKEEPQNWLFWLDKRWSRFLLATGRVE